MSSKNRLTSLTLNRLTLGRYRTRVGFTHCMQGVLNVNVTLKDLNSVAVFNKLLSQSPIRTLFYMFCSQNKN